MVSEKRKLRKKAKHKQKPKTEQLSEKTSFSAKFKITIMSTILFGLLAFVGIFMLLQFVLVNTTLQNSRQNAVIHIFKQLNAVQKQIELISEDINNPSGKYVVKEELGKLSYGDPNRMTAEVDRINRVIFTSKQITDYKVNGILIFKNKSNNKIELVGASERNLWSSFRQYDTIESLNISKNYGAIIPFSIPNYYIVYLLQVPKNISAINSMWQLAAGMLLLALIFAYFFARSISKPLIKMEKTVSQIAQGDLSGRLEYTTYEEINQLVQSYNNMADTLQRLYSTLEKQVQDRTHELKSAYAELQSTQAMMVHSEKMKSLGELVAGIMHEINNPINFIYGNMTHLTNYSNDLINIIDEYSKYNDSLKPEEKQDIENLKQEVDYEFLKTDLPDLIKSCKEGADRAKNIIQDLKSFSRMEEVAITDIDIPKEIDTVLNILHNKIKNKADVHKEYIDSVPMIEAFGGQLNQVFMNILDNAVGAIPEHGDIWIRIKKDNSQKNLVIEIEDNGTGMDEETVNKVFNPFFTTKPVGQGTGLGMSITYKIIKNHQGDIKVESTPNVGTKFIVTLPINIDRELLAAGAKNGEAE